jgi:putative PEP-CTERM system integral membrane protein
MYYFNLPETAVLTGVWLGNSPDRSQRFAYQIAPRGAAQQIYLEERNRKRDPALLEQIGPRQYRLRVFPIEPDRATWDNERSQMVTEQTYPLYLWLTYRCLPVEGTWPLPQLAFKTNLFWDKNTTRLLNGEAAAGASEAAWMPAPPAAPETPAVQRADFPNGQSVILQTAKDQDLPRLPANVRLAVVLDRSKSMEAHAQQVNDAVARLREQAPDAVVDIYLAASEYSGETPSILTLDQLEPQTEYYLGGQNPAELLAQFESLQAERAYDGILVLTDASPYTLGASKLAVSVPSAPLWMVHLDSSIPLGYDDLTLEAIQASGGGVAANIDQALTRLAVSLDGLQRGPDAAGYEDIVDGYIVSVLPTAGADVAAPGAVVRGETDGLTPLLARQMVLAEMRRNRGTIKQLETLDLLHALAKQYSMVTPYSSMIVLVNEQQQARLDQLEQGEDRYEREFEVQPPLVGVPEPGEWLLLAVMAGLLGWYAYRQRTALQLR